MTVNLKEDYITPILDVELLKERTTRIHDILFFAFNNYIYKYEDIKERFKHLNHFKDVVIDRYISDYLKLLNTEVKEKVLDEAFENLAQYYSDQYLLANVDWLIDFHIRHDEYTKIYTRFIVQWSSLFINIYWTKIK